MIRDDQAMTLRDARRRYFEENGFALDGGYSDRWVKFRMGPLRFAIPNTPARVRAVRFHDLHHVATGYATDWTGEGEIGAWEVASSCAHHVAAWVLNFYAMSIGLLVAPRAIWRAFVRGRHTRNLYREEWSDALLDERVGALRGRLGLAAAPAARASVGDALAFAGWSAAALMLWLGTSLAVLAPIVLGLRAFLS